MASISPEACAGALLACCLEGRPWRENDLEPLLSGEHGHLLFSVVAEGLADRFEPRLGNSYAALFSEVIARKIDGVHAHHLFERYQRIRKPRESGTFEYDAGWLKRPDRFALEPAHILDEGPQGCATADPALDP